MIKSELAVKLSTLKPSKQNQFAQEDCLTKRSYSNFLTRKLDKKAIETETNNEGAHAMNLGFRPPQQPILLGIKKLKSNQDTFCRDKFLEMLHQKNSTQPSGLA